MANWGQAIRGLGDDLQGIVDTKRRENEMKWEEARQVRLENLRAKNNRSEGAARHGERMDEVAAQRSNMDAAAKQKNEWAIAAAKLERGAREKASDRNFEATRRTALNKITDQTQSAYAKIDLALKGNQEFESAESAVSSLVGAPTGSSDTANMMAQISALSGGSGSSPKGRYVLTEDAAKVLRERVSINDSMKRAAWLIEDTDKYNKFVAYSEKYGGYGAGLALSQAANDEWDKVESTFKFEFDARNNSGSSGPAPNVTPATKGAPATPSTPENTGTKSTQRSLSPGGQKNFLDNAPMGALDTLKSGREKDNTGKQDFLPGFDSPAEKDFNRFKKTVTLI